MINDTTNTATGEPVTEQAPTVDTTSTTVPHPVTAFGKSYPSLEALAEAFQVSPSVVYQNLAEGFDCEVAVIVPAKQDHAEVMLSFIRLDGKAAYKVSWDTEIQTARQVIEHYRPALLAVFDASNPTEKWNPVGELIRRTNDNDD